MKKIINKIFPLIIFIILTSIFYANLFLPKLSIYFTPDLGRSDIVHLAFPFHNLFSQIIKKGKIPLWTNQIGTGIPLLFSGKASFNVISYLLLLISSSGLSFDFSYVVFTMICLLSTYALGRYLKFSRYTSLFISVVFSFSGIFIFRLQHDGVFTTSCFLPLIFLLSLKTIENLRLVDGLLLAFVICQQIFIGHPQYVFITLLGASSFVVFSLIISE